MRPRSEAMVFALFLAPALSAAAGAPSDADPPPVTPTYYGIALEPDYDRGVIDVRCRMRVRNVADHAIRAVPLMLYRLLTVRSATDARGEPLPFVQDIVAFEDDPAWQFRRVDVELPAPLAPEGEVELVLEYDGYLRGYRDVGMLYVRDDVRREFTIFRADCDAYPKPAADTYRGVRAGGLARFAYDVAVTVPKDGPVVANGGELVSRRAAGDEVTYKFRNIEPAWRIDVAIAEYEVLERDGCRVYYLPEYAEGARRVAEAFHDAFDAYSGWFGEPAGYRGFAIIQVPDGYGSQADVTAIIQAGAAFEDPSRVREVYHEVAHRWNVTPTDPAPCRVESEGFATFMEHFLEARLADDPSMLTAALDRILETVHAWYDARPHLADLPMAQYGDVDEAGGLAYVKGALFFALLREAAGADAFNEVIARHYRTYHKTGASLAQWAETCRSVCGGRADRLIEEWLYGAESSDAIREAGSFRELLAACD